MFLIILKLIVPKCSVNEDGRSVKLTFDQWLQEHLRPNRAPRKQHFLDAEMHTGRQNHMLETLYYHWEPGCI